MVDETRGMAERALRDRETAEAIFARRRYHETGNHPDGTFAKLRKWERIGFWYVMFSLFVGTPLCVAVMVDMFFRFGPREPIPWYYTFLVFGWCLFVCPAIGCLGVWMTRAREQRGRWIIAWGGVFYRYGKEPYRFVPFSDVRGIRVEKPKSDFLCVVLQTEGEPLRIGERVDGRRSTDFLPFLNELADRLQNSDPALPGLDALVLLRNRRRMQLLERLRLRYFESLQMSVYLLALLPVACGMTLLKNLTPGQLLTVSALLIFVAVAVGHLFRRLAERWKIRRLDGLYRELLRREDPKRCVRCHAYPPPRLEPEDFGPAPRHVTAAARRRLRFTWASLTGWVALLFAGLLLVGVATEGKVVAVLGMSVLLTVFPGSLGIYSLIYERYFGRKVIALFARGIPVRGRIRHVGTFRLAVDLPPEYGGTVTLMREDHQRTLHFGERVTVFVEQPEEADAEVDGKIPGARFTDEFASRKKSQRKIRRAVYEQTTLAVHYDRDANTFDSGSRLPWAEPFCVLLFLGSLLAVVRLLLPF